MSEVGNKDSLKDNIKGPIKTLVAETIGDIIYKLARMSTKRVVNRLKGKLKDKAIRKLENSLKDLAERKLENQLSRSAEHVVKKTIRDNPERVDFIRGIEQGFEEGFEKYLSSLAKALISVKTIAIVSVCVITIGGGAYAWANVTNTLSVSVDPSGSGSVYPYEGDFRFGTLVTITASPSQGWRFDHWGGAASGVSTTTNIRMNSDKRVAAYFVPIEAPELTLNIEVEGDGTTYPRPGEYTYNQGARITITVLPAQGWKFDHWGGAASGETNQTTIFMNTNKNIKAYFVPIEPTKFTLSIAIEGEGTTNPSPGTYEYDQGTLVTIIANHALGSCFDHWEGDIYDTSSTINITVDSDIDVIAYFEGVDRLPGVVSGYNSADVLLYQATGPNAINDAVSMPGVTKVIVGPGWYTETINVHNNDITIESSTPENICMTVIIGEWFLYGDTFVNGCTLSGLFHPCGGNFVVGANCAIWPYE